MHCLATPATRVSGWFEKNLMLEMASELASFLYGSLLGEEPLMS
jgi:hypothetical protein